LISYLTSFPVFNYVRESQVRTLEAIVSIVMSILFGMIPEVLFFTLFLIYTKGLKEKRMELFVGVSIIYILCIMVNRFKTLYYVSFIFLISILLKILYKNKAQIIDTFMFSISTIYLSLIGFLCSRFVNNNYCMYYIMLLLNRILLFVPFIFKDRFNALYKLYCSLWNRNDKVKKPIKSITLRNVSLSVLNIFIFIMNIISVSMTNFIK